MEKVTIDTKKMRRIIREELTRFTTTFKEKTIDFISNAFAFVTAISWNDTIKEYVQKQLITLQHQPLIYPLAVTSLSIFVIYILQKLKEKK